MSRHKRRDSALLSFCPPLYSTQPVMCVNGCKEYNANKWTVRFSMLFVVLLFFLFLRHESMFFNDMLANNVVTAW